MDEVVDLAEYPVRRDKQLCVLVGEHYQLPAFKREIASEDKTKKLWAVHPAMELNQAQYLTFFEVLEPRAYARHGRFLFFKEPIDSLVKPVYGCTPQYWYQWMEEERAEGVDDIAPDTAEIIEVSDKVDEEFLREVIRRTQFADMPKMKILWAAIIQVAMQWMVNQRKPLHLGFATIFAAPYRSNWKSIMLAFFPKSHSACNRSGPKSEKAMEEMGITRHFRSRELLEITPDHTCNWKLEVIPTRLWAQCVAKIERIRIQHGREAYAKFIARSIMRLQKHIAAAYRNFALRAAAPAARFQRLAVGNRQALVPSTPKGGIRPCSVPSSSVVICADTSADSKEPTLVSLIEREIDEVSKLPNLRSQIVELRISGSNLQLPEKSTG